MASDIAHDIAVMNIDPQYRAQEARFDTVSVALTKDNKLIVSANVKQRRKVVFICFFFFLKRAGALSIFAGVMFLKNLNPRKPEPMI